MIPHEFSYHALYQIAQKDMLHRKKMLARVKTRISLNEPVHEISNNVVCATSKASDQPAHTRSLIRAFARRLNVL